MVKNTVRIMNEQMLARRTSVIIPDVPGIVRPNNSVVMSLMANTMQIGYILSGDVIAALNQLPDNELTTFSDMLIDILSNMKGSGYKYRPLFSDFLSAPMDAASADRLEKAREHYESMGAWLPDDISECDGGLPLKISEEKYEVIRLGKKKEYYAIMSNLMASKTPLPPHDRYTLKEFFENFPDAWKSVPDDIPIKENLVEIVVMMLNSGIDQAYIRSMFKTATDVLRYAAARCGNGVSLASNPRFKGFTRKERKFILSTLEMLTKGSSFEENMLSYKGQWVRLGEVLHPGEYKDRYPKIFEVFRKLRENEPIPTYMGKVDTAIASGDTTTALRLLSKRPGIFARRLNELLGKADDKQEVVNAFRKVSTSIPTTTLLNIMTYFSSRDESGTRVFFPKGQVSSVYVEKAAVLRPVDEKYTKQVVAICRTAIISQYSTRDGMGTVYIDPAMKDYKVPVQLRNAAKQLKTVARGSSFAFPDDAKFIRSFIYWKNGESRTDIDLSIVAYNGDYGHLYDVAYYGLTAPNGCMTHSGDITDAPHGASEFVDIDIDKAIASGTRYAVMAVNSYTTQPYCDLPICFGGWMFREERINGKVYEPTTVRNKFDLTGNQITDMVCVFDLVERKVIWVDMSMRGMNTGAVIGHYRANNAASHLTGISAILKATMESDTPNLYDVFTMNATARGIIVDTPDEADIVITPDESDYPEKTVIRPFDTDVIMAQYL